MTTARSHRLWGKVLLAANPTTVATVPAGETWLLKTWVFYNSDSSTRNVSLYVGSYDVPAWGLRSQDVLAAAGVTLPTWLVFEAGDVIKLDPSALNKIYATAYGAKLAA